MRSVPGTDIAAVCSRTRVRALEFARKHEIAGAYDDIKDLLRDARLQAVFVASPNYLHAEHALAAIHAGKHVLVEKPVAVSVSEGKEMIKSARECGVHLGVGFHLRYHPGHRRAQELLQKETLGTISLIQGQWCSGQRGVVYPPPRSGSSAWWDDPIKIGMASTLMGTGIHVIDLLYFLTGQPIVEVAAITDGQTEKRPLEQAAAVAVRFKNGMIGTICAGRRMPDSENDVMIYGSHGRIALRDTLWETFRGQMEVTSESNEEKETYDADALMLYRSEIKAFNRSIKTGETFRASGMDGLHAIRVLLAIVESARTKRTVMIEHEDHET